MTTHLGVYKIISNDMMVDKADSAFLANQGNLNNIVRACI